VATAPSISERPAKKFEPRTIAFPDDVKAEINKWLHDEIEALLKRLQNLHEVKVPRWREIKDGRPREKNKSWPFPNCSNLVHQLVGEACDDLSARVLQLIWVTAPLFYFKYFGKAADEEEAAHNSLKAKTLETFIDYVSADPRELALYPRENKWFMESAALGKAWVCVVPEHRMEAVYAGYHEDKRESEFDEKTLYEGPKVVNLRYEDVLVNPDVDVFEDNDPIVRRCVLNNRKMRERAFKGFFLNDETKKVLESPDRYGASPVKKKENQKRGIQDTQDQNQAEWDIYECYFSWYHNRKKFRLIAWYHQKTKTLLNCVYNFIPENQVPIVETRLTEDGRGYADIGEHAQEEVSTAKNQRNDAITWGILGLNRVSPQNRNIDRNFTITPGMAMPYGKDEFEHYEVANPAMSAISLQNEGAMIQQAKERFGIGPAVSGMGAGSSGKKGQYGSMGTIAVMQDSNTRSSHRQSDFRFSHVKLGGLYTDFYGFMGLGRKGSVFGLDDDILAEALRDFIDRKLRVPIRAATASVNREVTKQNQIILNQAIDVYIKSISQLVQAAMNPAIEGSPGGLQYLKWLRKQIKAKNRWMQNMIREWQVSDQPQEYIPDIELEEPKQNAAPQQQQPPQPGGGPVNIQQKMAELIRQRQGGGGAGAPGVAAAPPGPPIGGGGPQLPPGTPTA